MDKQKQPAAPLPLRLEWRTPSELADNPDNWRTHPTAQTDGLAAVIGEVGWAGAALYNSRTKRLIDGHARKNLPASLLVDGKIPVLVGDWSEEQEKTILLTLDPLAALAEADTEILGKLLLHSQNEDEAVQALLDGLAEENGIDVFDASLPPGADGKEYDESTADDVKKIKCPECGNEFPI
jgi:hypothetical protein